MINNNISTLTREGVIQQRRLKKLRRKRRTYIISLLFVCLICIITLKIINIVGESNNIDTSQELSSNSIPLFLQYDKRWGNLKYGDDTIAKEGCGPTCLAMVIVGLTKDDSIDPKVVADFSKDNGYYAGKDGTKWSLMTEGASHYGINSYEIPLDKDMIINELEAGNPIICSMGPGDFTNKGHFIVLKAYKDGKFEVNDPNSRRRSKKLWKYEDISDQIRAIWSFSL